MIGDLIPNIPSEAKTATDASKGASEVEKGVFSTLLKTFEQAVLPKGNNGNQSLTGNHKAIVNQEQSSQSTLEDASPEETDSDVLNTEESGEPENEQSAKGVHPSENDKIVEEGSNERNVVTDELPVNFSEREAVQQQSDGESFEDRKADIVEDNSETVESSISESLSNESNQVGQRYVTNASLVNADNTEANQSKGSGNDERLTPAEISSNISASQVIDTDQQAVLGDGKNVLTGKQALGNPILDSVSKEISGDQISALKKPVSNEFVSEKTSNLVLDQKQAASFNDAVSANSSEQSFQSNKEISGQVDKSLRTEVSDVQSKQSIADSESTVNKMVEEVASSKSNNTGNSSLEITSGLKSVVEQSTSNVGVETSTTKAGEIKNSLKPEEKEIPQNKQVDANQVERTVMPEQQPLASVQSSDKFSKEPVINVQHPVRLELANETLNQQQFRNTEQIQNNKEVANPAFPISFSTTQSSEILQVIQQNKALAKVTKDVKSHRFALSNTEQAETRLKLLVDSVRPEILSSRELPADFITTSSDVEITGFPMLSGAITNEQELMLKELMVETTSGKEVKNSEANAFSFLRLSDLPILNSSARRSLVDNFGKVLQESLKADQANKTEQWQKHSFKLEEGNSIDLTTRNIDGVLHVKLAASNPELNRLLQSMEQEIKDHLKEELGLDLDLQFDQSSGEKDAESLQKGILNEKMKIAANQARELQQGETGKTNSGLSTSIRTFGYNQMEWTA